MVFHFDAAETTGGHPDHGERLLVHNQGPAQNSGIRGETGPPEIMAQDHDRMGMRSAVIGLGEEPAKGCAHAQDGE